VLLLPASKDMGSYERGRIWVGNLLPECADQDLREYFSEFGDVREASVARDTYTKLSRGFGFIKMGSQMLVEKILKEEHKIWNRALSVKLASDVEIEPEKPPAEDPKIEEPELPDDKLPPIEGEEEIPNESAEGDSGRKQDWWSKDSKDSSSWDRGYRGRDAGNSDADWKNGASEDSRAGGGYDRGSHSQPYDRQGGGKGRDYGDSRDAGGSYGGGYGGSGGRDRDGFGASRDYQSSGRDSYGRSDNSSSGRDGWGSRSDGNDSKGSYGSRDGRSKGGYGDSSKGGSYDNSAQDRAGGYGKSGGYGGRDDRAQPYGRSGGGDSY